jgi:hypothetical protein
MAAERPLRLALGRPRSRVIQVRCPEVIDAGMVHKFLASEMIEHALCTLTGTVDPADAWRSILAPHDLIGLKFNRSGQDVLGTTGVFASALIESIVGAGWSPRQVICIEAPPGTARRHGTGEAYSGYESATTDFGSGTDRFASVLGQVTALIDVPYLKTHNIAGLTCALKNLSHGFVKHPARYHCNGCSPYVPDIVSASPIRDKLRLCLVDAFRVVFDRGPEANVETISDEGMLLASFDPVATDVVGLTHLNQIRRRFRLTPVARSVQGIGYLAQAHRKGLGVASWDGIDVVDRDV